MMINIEEVRLDYPISREDFKRLRVGGSIMHHDAEILYSLVRALEPYDILELGAFVGISTNVLVRAVRENGKGHIVSLDKYSPGREFKFGNNPDTTLGWVGRTRSERVPAGDLDVVTMETGDVVQFLKAQADDSFDFVFEDTDHARRTIAKAVPEIKRILRPGGIVLFHNTDLPAVQQGFEDARVSNQIYYFKGKNGSSIGMMEA